MLSSVLRTIRRERLCAAGDRVLVAVSGGADSMALLHALWELATRLGIALEVATVDHGMRPEARREAESVRERASQLELPWHLLTVDVRAARRAAKGVSWQDAARQVRLAALSDLARARDASRVALGHQADDQAETVLFRVLRGTGVLGLCGIPYARDPFIRPLLDVRREEINRYLKRRSITVVDDPSNVDRRFARGRLRSRVLPLLREENPRVVEALLALAADATRVVAGTGAPLSAGLPGVTLARGARAAIDHLRRRGGSASVDVPGGRVEVAYGVPRFVAAGAPRHPSRGGRDRAARGRAVPGPLTALPIPGPGSYRLGAGEPGVDRDESAIASTLRACDGGEEILVEVSDQRQSGQRDVVAAVFDGDLLSRPLRLRARRSGDRMIPRGGRGSRKLSDLLIDAKVARSQRGRLPVLTTADDIILFVPGLRPSQFARPTPATRRFVYVTSTKLSTKLVDEAG